MAANTQTAAKHYIAPRIAIGVISTAVTDPGAAVGLLNTQATWPRALGQAVALLEGEVGAASGAT